jgi:hypothetical protein
MNNARLRLFVGIAVETVRENAPVVRYLGPSALSGFAGQALAAIGAVPGLPGLASPALEETSAGAVCDTVLPLEGARTDIGWAREHSVPWVLNVAGSPDASGLLDLRPTVLTGGRWDGVSLVPGTPTVVRADGEEFSFNLPQTDLSRVFGAEVLIPALAAACATVASPVEAAIAAAGWVALAAERAAANSNGPASLRVALIDELATVGGDEVAEAVVLN